VSTKSRHLLSGGCWRARRGALTGHLRTRLRRPTPPSSPRSGAQDSP
jgi:hypothetical protein